MNATQAPTTKIKLNSIVEWSSSANGTTSRKRGQVVAIVQPGDSPVDKVTTKLAKDCICRFDGQVRDHRSYLVRVARGEGKKDYLYFPRVNTLSVV